MKHLSHIYNISTNTISINTYKGHKMFKFLKPVINFLSFLKTTSQLEYYVRSKNPQTHSEVERLVRDFYSIRSM